MAWRVWSVDTRTGRKQSVIPVTGFSWSCALNSGSGGTASAVLNAANSKGLDWWGLMNVVQRTLVIEWDGAPVYAGVIWSWDYDYDTKRLTVNHADLWSLLTRRMLFTTYSDLMKKRFTIASASLWDMVRGVIEAGTAGAYSLPIFMQGTTGGTKSRTWYGYELPMVADELETLMNTAGGPDIAMVPRWSDDESSLEWLIYDGVEVGGLIPVNLSANKKMIHGLKIKRDANECATVVVGTGEGSEQDLDYQVASIGGSFYPHMVKTMSFPKEKDGNMLYDRTWAEAGVVAGPVEQWSASMNASDAFKVTMVKLGRPFRMYSHGDPLILNGQYDLKVIQFSGDLSETVKLEFQDY